MGRQNMTRILILLLVAVSLLVAVFYVIQPGPEPGTGVAESGPVSNAKEPEPPSMDVLPEAGLPKKAVLDISVHTIDELKVLFDRAEKLAMTPKSPGEEAKVVLVLHGPEVEFFSTDNYDEFWNGKLFNNYCCCFGFSRDWLLYRKLLCEKSFRAQKQ